jgi:single-strand DNA-binding protein
VATYELTGTVKVVMEAMTFGSGFSKREFVVTTDDKRYPQDIKFECVKDRMSLLDATKPGDRVTVSFDLRGNESKGRYYVSLSVWKLEIEKDAAGQNASEDGPPLDKLVPPAEETGDDNLPF